MFISIGWETAKRFEQVDIESKLNQLSDEEEYGNVLRAKGILQDAAGNWFQFDYVPGEENVRLGAASTMGRLCVIGSKIDTNAMKALFGVE